MTAFGAALLSEAAGWMTRFWHPGFAWLKVAMFVLFQGTLAVLILGLGVFLASAEALRRRRHAARHRADVAAHGAHPSTARRASSGALNAQARG